MADITLRILGQEPLPLNLGSDNSETLSVGSGVTESRLQEVLQDYVPKSDIDDTLSIEGDVAEAKATGDAIAEINSKLADILPSDSASGAIASFSDGAKDFPLKSLEVEIEPVQNLNGQSAPYPAGGGDNLFNKEALTSSSSVGVTQIDDGFVLKTLTAGTYKSITVNIPGNFAGKTIYVKGIITNSGSNNGVASIRFYNNGSEISTSVRAEISANRSEQFKEAPAGTTEIRAVMYSSMTNQSAANDTATFKNFIISIGDKAYSPYSNICPISGWDSVNVVRTGKNLIKNILYQASSTVVDLGQNDNTSFGTPLKAGTYTISYSNSGQNPSIYIREENDSGNTSLGTVTQKTFTIDKSGNYRFWLYRSAGVSASDISNVQLEVGSSKTDYATYTGQSYTIPLPSTVYGGTLNVTTGELVVDRKLVSKAISDFNGNANVSGRYWVDVGTSGEFNPDASNLSNIATSSISSAISNGQFYLQSGFRLQLQTNYATKDDFSNAMGANQFVFCGKLATPTTIPLTPTEIKTLLGDNNIFADSGDVSVVYSADIAKYIDKRIGL